MTRQALVRLAMTADAIERVTTSMRKDGYPVT
jgi:hypothetical protein